MLNTFIHRGIQDFFISSQSAKGGYPWGSNQAISYKNNILTSAGSVDNYDTNNPDTYFGSSAIFSRTDKAGKSFINKRIVLTDKPAQYYSYINDIVEDNSGNIYLRLVGSENSTESTSGRIANAIIKVNSRGNLIWAKKYYNRVSYPKGMCLDEATGNLIIAQSIGTDGSSYWSAQSVISSDGVFISSKGVFSLSGLHSTKLIGIFKSRNSTDRYSAYKSYTPDSGILHKDYKNSITVIKENNSGTLLWAKTFKTDDQSGNVIPTNDGGILLISNVLTLAKRSFNEYIVTTKIVKVSSTGTVTAVREFFILSPSDEFRTSGLISSQSASTDSEGNIHITFISRYKANVNRKASIVLKLDSGLIPLNSSLLSLSDGMSIELDGCSICADGKVFETGTFFGYDVNIPGGYITVGFDTSKNSKGLYRFGNYQLSYQSVRLPLHVESSIKEIDYANEAIDSSDFNIVFQGSTREFVDISNLSPTFTDLALTIEDLNSNEFVLDDVKSDNSYLTDVVPIMPKPLFMNRQGVYGEYHYGVFYALAHKNETVVAGGYMDIYDPNDSTSYIGSSAILTKTDMSGHTFFKKKFTFSNHPASGYFTDISFIQYDLSDNVYVIFTGSNNDHNSFCVVKFNSNYEVLWAKEFSNIAYVRTKATYLDVVTGNITVTFVSLNTTPENKVLVHLTLSSTGDFVKATSLAFGSTDIAPFSIVNSINSNDANTGVYYVYSRYHSESANNNSFVSVVKNTSISDITRVWAKIFTINDSICDVYTLPDINGGLFIVGVGRMNSGTIGQDHFTIIKISKDGDVIASKRFHNLVNGPFAGRLLSSGSAGVSSDSNGNINVMLYGGWPLATPKDISFLFVISSDLVLISKSFLELSDNINLGIGEGSVCANGGAYFGGYYYYPEAATDSNGGPVLVRLPTDGSLKDTYNILSNTLTYSNVSTIDTTIVTTSVADFTEQYTDNVTQLLDSNGVYVSISASLINITSTLVMSDMQSTEYV